jgi:hypothetical protein
MLPSKCPVVLIALCVYASDVGSGNCVSAKRRPCLVVCWKLRMLSMMIGMLVGDSVIRSQLQTTNSDQQTCGCKSIAQTIPILNKLPVRSVDGEGPYALSSGQAHFQPTKRPSLESAGTFHADPEESYRAHALHVESGGPDGQISLPVVGRIGKRRALSQSGRLRGVCTHFDAKTSCGCEISRQPTFASADGLKRSNQ